MRKNEGEEDVTYINERNKHFNKKVRSQSARAMLTRPLALTLLR